MDLKELGFTKEELQDRVVEAAVNRLLSSKAFHADGDGDGYEEEVASDLGKRMEKLVKERIDAKISELAEKYVLPNVSKYVENVVLQETNRWGEKTGKAQTFVEYLVARAEAHINEQVDFNGKDKETGGYGWTGRTTRIVYLVKEHLHYRIEEAMKTALAQANSTVKGGLEAAMKLALEHALKSLRVEVSTGR